MLASAGSLAQYLAQSGSPFEGVWTLSFCWALRMGPERLLVPKDEKLASVEVMMGRDAGKRQGKTTKEGNSGGCGLTRSRIDGTSGR